MVFNAIKKPFWADNFLFFSYFLDINFLFYEAQNIYFVPNCTGQSADSKLEAKHYFALYFCTTNFFLFQNNIPENKIDTFGGKVCTFGSYRLGVHTKGMYIYII